MSRETERVEPSVFYAIHGHSVTFFSPINFGCKRTGELRQIAAITFDGDEFRFLEIEKVAAQLRDVLDGGERL